MARALHLRGRGAAVRSEENLLHHPRRTRLSGKRVGTDRRWKGLAWKWQLFAFAAAFPLVAAADAGPLGDLLVAPGSAGLGAMIRSERSPYKGVGVSQDLVPLYLYEGKRFFLHPMRAGLKLADDGRHRVDLFLDYRFEGFPGGRIPASLAGMQSRESTTDLGVSYAYQSSWGKLKA